MPSTVEFHLISEAPICGTLIRMTDRTTYVFGLCDYVKSCGFFGLSQCDWSQAWFHKRSYTVTIGASSAGAITCGHLDFPTFQRTRVSPQAKKKMKHVSLCWQTSLSSQFVGNSSQFHFPSHSTLPLNPIGPKRNPILAPKLSSSPMQAA